MNQVTLAIVTALPVLIFKVGVLIVGYLITKMGFDLFIKGVTGEFKFKSDIKGIKADLVSASPGTFFVLMGAAVIAFSIFKSNPYSFEAKAPSDNTPKTDQINLPNKLPEGL